MRILYSIAIVCALLFAKDLAAQTNPTPFDLSTGDYSLTAWDAASPAKTYPVSMRFHTISMTSLVDTLLKLNYEMNSDWDTVYNRPSGARIDGQGTNGFSFLNTSSSPYVPVRMMGAAVLSINTTNRINIRVGWNAGTIDVGTRLYAVVLQYRIGQSGTWQTAIQNVNDTVQYKGSTTAGHSQAMPTFTLPPSCENQPDVQIRWRYYQWSNAVTGTRPRIRVDDILVQSDASTGVPVKLAVTSIVPALPSVLTPFSITVQAQNSQNQPRNVLTATSVQLSVGTGSGTLSGTITATIPQGQNTVTISGILYNVAEQNVRIAVTRTTGDNLSSGLSQPFTVLPRASVLAFQGVPTNLFTNTPSPAFSVNAQRSDLSTDANYPGPITLSKLSGPGSISGTLSATPINGTVIFNDISFSAPGQYVLMASGPNITSGNSSVITVVTLPVMTEIVFPQYMVSANASSRIPTFALVRFDNLQPNTAYRYAVGADSTRSLTGIGGGNNMHYNANANLLNYNANPRDLDSPGDYSQFVTGANETSKVLWLNLVATSNIRFTEGNKMYWIVTFRDTTRRIDARIVSNNYTNAWFYGTTPNKLTGIVDSASGLAAKSIICLYDNAAGTGNPLSSAIVQEDATSIIAAVPYYAAMDAVPGSWATVLPNTLANGVRRVEQRDFITGNIINSWTDDDGRWTPANTVNPNGGTTAIGFRTPRVQLSPSVSSSNYCTTAPAVITWTARGVATVNLQISRNGINYTTFATVPAANGQYVWNLPDSLAGATTLQLRIVDAERSNVLDISGQFTINSPASIVKQPTNKTVCIGGTATLEIQAAGTNLSFQWEKDGVLLPGTNSPQLILTNVNPNSAGLYRCIVNAAVGCPSANSTYALLTIARKVEVTRQPGTTVSGIGRTAVLSIEASQETDVAYQWYRGTTALTESNRLTGTRTNTLTIRNLVAGDFGSNYNVVVTTACGSVTSNNGAIVSATLGITQQPEAINACENGTAAFSIAVTSSVGGTITYQWMKDGKNLSDNARIKGSTTTNLNISNVAPGDTGKYSCVVVSIASGIQVSSNEVKLSLSKAPSVVLDPKNTVACLGGEATLGIATDGGVIGYQWLLNNTPVPNAKQATLKLSSVAAAQAGSYKCVVFNDCGVDTSGAASLTIQEQTVITVQPRKSIRILEGNTIVLSVEATGANLRYQWFKDGKEIGGSGAQAQTLTINNALLRDAGKYTCRVTGDCGVINSDESTVDIVTDVADELLAADGMLLEQNAPNPYEHQTVIAFSIPSARALTLSISDMFGRELRSIDLGITEAGKHTITFDANNLSNGSYYYTLRSGTKALTKRMVILK